jgi:O-antigen ligase
LVVLQIVLAGSRAAITGCALFLCGWLVLEKKVKGVLVIAASCAALALLWSVVSFEGGADSLSIVNKVANIEADLDYGGSSRERLNIFVSSLQIIADHWLVGVGPGQFERYIAGVGGEYAVAVPNPHSMPLEIATQYGLPILFSFFCLIWLIFRNGLVIATSAESTPAAAKVGRIVVAAVPVYVIAMNINSTYVSLQFFWLFLGSIGAVTASLMSGRGEFPLQRRNGSRYVGATAATDGDA